MHISGLHLRGSDRQTRLPFVQQGQVDQFSERTFQRFGRIIAGTLGTQRDQAEKGHEVRLEEIGEPAGDSHHVRSPRAKQWRRRYKLSDWRAGDPAPELFEAPQAQLRWVASDQTGIDGADGSADHPIRLDSRFAQRLIDPGLIGAECAAALQYQDDLAQCVAIEFGGTCRLCHGRSLKVGSGFRHSGGEQHRSRQFQRSPKESCERKRYGGCRNASRPAEPIENDARNHAAGNSADIVAGKSNVIRTARPFANSGFYW